MFTFFRQRRIWSFHVVVLQRTVKKCTKNYNARAHPLFCSLNLLFSDVPVAVAVVVFLNSLIFMYLRPCSITRRVQFDFSCKIIVAFSASFFWQCEDYSEQSKSYFEPLTFAELRCSLKLEYFDFVYLRFHWVYLTLFAYIKFIIINRRREFFVDSFRYQVKHFRSTDCGVLGSSLPFFSFTVHCENFAVKHK